MILGHVPSPLSFIQSLSQGMAQLSQILSPFTISLKLQDIQHVPPDIVIFCKNTTFDKRITSIQHVPPDVRIATSTLFCKNTTLDTRTASDLLFRSTTLTSETFIVTLSLVGTFFNLNVCSYQLSMDWLGLIKSETPNLQMTNRLITTSLKWARLQHNFN